MTDKQIVVDGVDVSECEQETKMKEFYQDGLDQLKAENETYKQKLDEIKKVCNKFIPDHYKILLIINGGIVED